LDCQGHIPRECGCRDDWLALASVEGCGSAVPILGLTANAVQAAESVQDSDPVQVADPVRLEGDSAHSTNGIQAANPVQEELHQILAQDDEHQTEHDDWIDVKPNAVPQPANLYEVDQNNRFADHIIQGMAKMRARRRDEG
jgi:hypothetical protein